MFRAPMLVDGLRRLEYRGYDSAGLAVHSGKGVEIGPGPKPQIHNGPDTQVLYVEEMPAERWVEAPDALRTLGADLGIALVAYKRRIGRYLLWRAGPARGADGRSS